MKHIVAFWKRIPRPLRAAMNLVTIALLGVVFYYALGWPMNSFEAEFRRMERANLLGPGTIVDTLTNEEHGCDYRQIIVAESSHGVTFYTGEEDGIFFELYHREKTGDLTILAAPTFWPNWGSQPFDHRLAVYLFDEYPEAFRAELELTVSGTYHFYSDYEIHEDFTEHYALEAQREKDGFFRFEIYVPYTPDENFTDPGAFMYAPQFLSEVCNNGAFSINEDIHTAQIPATVRLYNKKDELLVEKSLTIRSAQAAALDAQTE